VLSNFFIFFELSKRSLGGAMQFLHSEYFLQEESHFRSLQQGLNSVPIPVADFCFVRGCKLNVGVIWPRQAPPSPLEPPPFPPLAPGFHVADFPEAHADDYDNGAHDVPVKILPGSVSSTGVVSTLEVTLSPSDPAPPSGATVDVTLAVKSCEGAAGPCSNAPAPVHAFVYAVDARWLAAAVQSSQISLPEPNKLTRDFLANSFRTGNIVSTAQLLTAEKALEWLQVCLNVCTF
jgi:hypothetical protein